MKTGMTRPLDALGRVVIPKEIRKSLKWNEGNLLHIKVKEDRIILEKSESACVFCGSTEIEKAMRGMHVCSDCIQELQTCVD